MSQELFGWYRVDVWTVSWASHWMPQIPLPKSMTLRNQWISAPDPRQVHRMFFRLRQCERVCISNSSASSFQTFVVWTKNWKLFERALNMTSAHFIENKTWDWPFATRLKFRKCVRLIMFILIGMGSSMILITCDQSIFNEIRWYKGLNSNSVECIETILSCTFLFLQLLVYSSMLVLLNKAYERQNSLPINC